MNLDNKRPKRILFATFPADGHFSPLTGLAVHLKNKGHDVRWYTQSIYERKLQKLNIPHLPFKKALQFNMQNIDEVFPEKTKIKSKLGRLKFDLVNIFVSRGPEFYEDVQEIERDFDFDIMIADFAFTAIPLVRVNMKKPVIAIGVLPLMETSVDLPPAGLGMHPSSTPAGKFKQRLLRIFADKVIFRKANKLYKNLLEKEGVSWNAPNLFDAILRRSSLVLQIGTPGFEYTRSDLGKNIRFIGSLLPHHTVREKKFQLQEKHHRYEKIILVTQGTVEKDTRKIIEPVLNAFKDSRYLVIATTGGFGTAELKSKYQDHDNMIIEDFIPFQDVMPHCDVYITNGGYGGVMLAIANNLPLIVAGMNEGKDEINARVGYFKLGIDLKTESPSAWQIRNAAETIFYDSSYRKNVVTLADEFKRYDPNTLAEKYIDELTK